MEKYTARFWYHISKKDTKIKNRIYYNWLNYDNLGEIITDGNIYWIELTNSNAKIPSYVHKYIKRFMGRQGFKYLYDATKEIERGDL
jgi:hypothetical protein